MNGSDEGSIVARGRPRLEREIWVAQFRTELRRLRPAMANDHLWSFAESAWSNGGLLHPRVVASVVAKTI